MLPATNGRGLLVALVSALAAPACGAAEAKSVAGLGAAEAKSHAERGSPPARRTENRDWSDTLLRDAQALHAAMLDSHPGAVDPENPGFRAMLDAGLAKTRERARTTRDFAGYSWALSEYVARFDDEAVRLSLRDDSMLWELSWPGFLTGASGERQVVMTREEDAALPLLGAELVSCDGRDAATLLAENVGAFEGRWFLPDQRERAAGLLFLDLQNPWIVRPVSCVFKDGGVEKIHQIRYRPMALEEVDRRLRQTHSTYRPPSGVYFFGAGGVWITLSNLNSPVGHKIREDPTVLFIGAFGAILDDLEASKAALRRAPVIVLDLRGNYGGFHDDWAHTIAEVVWGPEHVRAHEQPARSSFRASQANLDHISAALSSMKADPDPDPVELSWLQAAVNGVSSARARGETYWHDAGEAPAAKRARRPAPLTRAPVFVVTDTGCGSSGQPLCLAAVDLWKAMGAVHIGRETSADSLYSYSRYERLPGGFYSVSVPMRVFRGRSRGSNEPLRPAYRFEGDLRDTQALMAWVATLPRARR